VNVGLIPSSEAGWLTACAALRTESGGILHVHATVTSSRSDSVEYKPTVHSVIDSHHSPVCDASVSSSVTNSSHCAYDDTAADGNDCGRNACAGCSDQTMLNSVVDSADTTAAKARTIKFAKTCATKQAWCDWAATACETLRGHLTDLLLCDWSVFVMHIEHIKSYAPHIDHVVADIECRPPL